MTQYIKFPTLNGETILVEIAEGKEKIDDLVRAGLAEKVKNAIIIVQENFESAMMTIIERNAEAFNQTMQALPKPIVEAEISFGVKAIAEAGYSAVAKTGGEANYTVRLVWRSEKNED